MTTVLVQTAFLLLLSQVLLGAVGRILSGWWGLPVLILQVWLILRIADVLRGEMLQAVRRRVKLVPWHMALWVVLFWQWPSVLFLPRITPIPALIGEVWNGAMFSVAGLVGVFGQTAADAVRSWLWVGVVLEALLFVLVAGRTIVRTPAGRRQAEQAARQVAAAGDWAPARRHKDVAKRRPAPLPPTEE
jgi:Na+/alanine symporter